MTFNQVYHNCTYNRKIEDYQAHMVGLFTWRGSFRSRGGISDLLVLTIL